MNNIFAEIGIIIIVATFFAYLLKKIKQPLIPAYIIAGVLIGPGLGQILMYLGIEGFGGLITSGELITNISEIGLAFLLFIVGIEIDFRRLRDVGLVATIGGAAHSIILFSIGFVAANFLGIIKLDAVYIGLVLAFSSTMVVVKLLSDNKEIDTLHGRIIIGMLLMEDLLAVLALATTAALNNFSFFLLLVALLKGVFLISLVIFATIYILPGLFRFAAKSQELLFLMSVSVCFTFSLLSKYIGHIMYYIFRIPLFADVLMPGTVELLKPGFSIVIGAFLAGLGLANLPYNIEIIGKVRSLRDFFSTIFFVSLGMALVLDNFKSVIIISILLSLLVLLVKPLVIMATVGIFGYKKRNSFLTGISMAQISEFSLIIVAQAMILGHISARTMSITTIVAIITITATSYLIKYDNALYSALSKYISVFEVLSIRKDELEYLPENTDNEVVLIGYDRLGYNIFNTLKKLKKRFVVVDFNPEIIKRLIKKRIHCIYGDIGDSEVLDRINLSKADIVISTIPNKSDNIGLTRRAKGENKKAIVFVTAHHVDDALDLYDAGADYVILPHFLGGERVSLLLEAVSFDIKKLIKTKTNHIKELYKRASLGHAHPKHE